MSAPEEKFEKMDWQDIRRILNKSKSRTRALNEKADPQEELLRSYFGAERFNDLRDLAQRGDKTGKELGNVVLLPGVMGSHLTVVEPDNDEDHVWVNLRRMVKGDMNRLRLSSDGKTQCQQ